MIDDETGEIYLTDDQEHTRRLEEKLDLYETFKRVLKDLIYENEEVGNIKIDELKLQINDLDSELKSVI